MSFIEQQKSICEKYGSLFCESPPFFKVGISLNLKTGSWPINGLRHHITDSTTGWYIWAGEELSTDPDFFVPLHVEHLKEFCPIVMKYLGLSPGWRFLIAPNHEDVWKDLHLLNV